MLGLKCQVFTLTNTFAIDSQYARFSLVQDPKKKRFFNLGKK